MSNYAQYSIRGKCRQKRARDMAIFGAIPGAHYGCGSFSASLDATEGSVAPSTRWASSVLERNARATVDRGQALVKPTHADQAAA